MTGLCIAPSAAINVAPHLEHATHDAQSAGLALVQTVMVVVMARLPFSLKNSTAATEKAACLMFMVVIFTMSFFNALDLASAARESATGVARGTIARAAGLNSRIADLRKSRSEVPPFKMTSAASASAAKTAAAEAVIARDKECVKVGTFCRKRTEEAAEAQGVLAGVLEQRELTEKAERLDTESAKLQKELLDLGPIPTHGDSTASKVTWIVGLFVKVSDDDVTELRPILFGFVVELIALLGPFFMLKRPAENAPPQAERPLLLSRLKRSSEPAKDATPAPLPAGVGQSPATPAKVKKAKQIKKAAVAGVGDVREWYDSRTAARAGNAIRVNECFSAYVQWCQSRGESGVSLTKFGTVMKGEIGVEYVERSKRGFYVGFALKAPGGLKVVGGTD